MGGEAPFNTLSMAPDAGVEFCVTVPAMATATMVPPVVADMVILPTSKVENAFGVVSGSPVGPAPIKAAVSRTMALTITETPMPVEPPPAKIMVPATETCTPPVFAVMLTAPPPVTSAPWLLFASMPAIVVLF